MSRRIDRTLVMSGKSFARHLLIHHRRLINECSHNRRGLLHVFDLNTVVIILVRVVRPGAVLDLILNELESRQADAVEGQVVSSSGVL